jgi:hypothetical protein
LNSLITVAALYLPMLNAGLSENLFLLLPLFARISRNLRSKSIPSARHDYYPMGAPRLSISRTYRSQLSMIFW